MKNVSYILLLLGYFVIASSAHAESYSRHAYTSASSSLSNALFTLLGVFVGGILSYFTAKWRADEDRKENFKLKLFELRINAAQTAYKYVFQVHRAYARNKKDSTRADRLAREARDWLDGEILILGEELHNVILTYFNSAGTNDKEKYELMEKAQKMLKSVMSEKRI